MTLHLFADPHLLTGPDFLLRAETGPACEPGKAKLSFLRSLGHKLERFLHAREVVHRRIFQDDTLAALKPWFGGNASSPANLKEDGTFVSVLLQSGGELRLGTVMLPSQLSSTCLTLWRQTDPEAPKILSPLLPSVPDAEAPLWLALLRLRPLRAIWESALRRDHFETLLQIFPHAWLLDATPLPPGAVIPHLELSRWGDLSIDSQAGHQFALASTDTMEGAHELNQEAPVQAWTDTVQSALGESATKPRILVALPRTPDSWLLAFYEKKGSRVDARGFLSLTRAKDDGWQAAKVR